MVRASALGVVDLGLILSWVKPMTLKLAFIAFLFNTRHQTVKETGWRTSQQVYLKRLQALNFTIQIHVLTKKALLLLCLV